MPPNYAPCVAKWKPKVPQWSPKATQSANETPQGFAKCHYDSKTYPKASLKSRLHPVASNFEQKASRGRVLAEGDVDPAAGSRDETFKAVGRDPSTKLVSQSVCIKLI